MGIAAPVVKSNAQNSWARIPSRHIYYYRSSQHNDRWILSFAFIFESSDPVQFAYCIPYTYGQLQSWLSELDARKYPFFHRDLLAHTVQKRRVDLITIDGSPDTFQGSKKMVFLTARVHPGETPSSHVMHASSNSNLCGFACSFPKTELFFVWECVNDSNEALGEAFSRALLNFYEADCGLRDVSLERPFKTFLPARAQKSLKKQARKVIQTVMMK
ncbi:hypothetical protein CAEBREN_02237 [Caenorhabditis brenneri]|uniref:Peptidase M14 carboxypeptidase A domain-containing protein n=1 Tax=Caenorhabditis brenneri TaxID=135651 RepID=G0PDF9_CAEBE|nr:hypothetical protein CAEBREN_02237 [Caenorhabditis brenneri]